MAIVRDRFIQVRSDDEHSALAFPRSEFSREFLSALPIQGRPCEFAVWKPSDFGLCGPSCDECGQFGGR